MKLTDQAILDFVARSPETGRQAIWRALAPDADPATVWRALKRLVEAGKLEAVGKGRATAYRLAGAAAVRAYLSVPFQQRLPAPYRKAFIDRYVPGKTFYLSTDDRARLRAAGTPMPPAAAGTYASRIVEKLLVDLSWASSRMEGNTYDILETERLIQLGAEAEGKDRKEAVMILNHKAAIRHLVDNLAEINVSQRDLFDIHALLADGLLVDPAMAGRLRRFPVGISYSSYRPLDDALLIEEEFRVLVEKAAAIVDPFEQSFFLMVHIPYLQAFEDVNKRTSRIAANISLLKADLAPMSFLAMNDKDYIDGLIGVYELNDISLFRDACINAYLASADNYRAMRAEAETPDKAALTYRDFVRAAVRESVLEFGAFRPQSLNDMAVAAGVPEGDRAAVVRYIGRELSGLHEGNVIRYRLRAEDLSRLDRRSLPK
ncbi:MAG: Fic family protein [Pseudomonadota bacterium]